MRIFLECDGQTDGQTDGRTVGSSGNKLMASTCALVPSSPAALQGSDDPVPPDWPGLHAGLGSGPQVHQARQHFRAGQRSDASERRSPVLPFWSESGTLTFYILNLPLLVCEPDHFLFFSAGVFTLVAVSWYASRVIQDFYDPMYGGVRCVPTAPPLSCVHSVCLFVTVCVCVSL